eukprot:9487188-Lingulodinium_polyedra.AAC.1
MRFATVAARSRHRVLPRVSTLMATRVAPWSASSYSPVPHGVAAAWCQGFRLSWPRARPRDWPQSPRG